MADLVSKSSVLDIYAELYDVFDDNKAVQKELDKVYDKLSGLKGPQTEYVDMGFDIDNEGRVTHRFDCKSCEYEIYGKSIIGLKYCPNCGRAVMRGE